MKRYLEHMQNKDPHERRTHALHVASAVTALVFVAWLGTLGMRLAPEQPFAQDSGDGTQAAAAVQATQQGGPHLQVSTSSVFLPQYNQTNNE